MTISHEAQVLEKLTDQIITGVEQQFVSSGHCPASSHWEGLRAIAETIVAMTFGQTV
jgi:hypothetical protein